MNLDPDIARATIFLIETHGADAIFAARRRIALLQREGSTDAAAIWMRIAAAIEELSDAAAVPAA